MVETKKRIVVNFNLQLFSFVMNKPKSYCFIDLVEPSISVSYSGFILKNKDIQSD